MNTIHESDLQPQEKPADGWFLIEPAGQHPTVYEGKEVMQNLTAEVLAAVAAAGVPPEGLPIDRDHLSLDRENSTEALGWVRELAICKGGLAARIEWTSLGLPLIQGRIYKFFSTVYPPDAEQMATGTFTPSRLIGLALTNQPNNKTGQRPISNRELAPTQTKTKTMEYPTEVLAALGLAEGASDEEVLGAIDALNKRATDAEAAKTAAADAEAEAIVNAEAAQAGATLTEEEKEKCKNQIVANRDHGLEYTQLLCNSKRTATPAEQPRRYPDKSAHTPVTGRQQVSNEQKIANRARAICDEQRRAGLRPDYWAALDQARAEAEMPNT